MREQVLNPAGLSPGIGTDVDVTVPGWFDMDFDGIADDVNRNPYLSSVPWAAGQMVSTARDLARFSTLLQTGGVLFEDSLQAMRDEGAFGQRYGLGLSWSTPDGSNDVVGHSGSVVGYTAVMWWVPSLETSIAVLLNDSHLGDPTDLAELVLRRLVTDGTPAEP